MRSLADLIAFNAREAARELPHFGQEILEMAEKKGPLTSGAYQRALKTCRTRARAEGIDAVMKKHRLDALVAPTGSPAWPTDLINGDHFLGASSTPAAVAGYPNITVPAGQVEGLPVGISFIGARLDRGAPHRPRVRLRTGHTASASADVPVHGGTLTDTQTNTDNTDQHRRTQTTQINTDKTRPENHRFQGRAQGLCRLAL